jgi:alpha-D-ribose 1-methylphosphonate 5-triphosphate diphosphatase
MPQTILTNARIVLPDRVTAGSVVFGGRVEAVEPGRVAAGCDLDGDWLIPGVVDVHTDNLERQVEPRANARWPSRSAMVAHDSQCAAAGVTTVLDALCVGDLGFEGGRVRTFQDGVADLDALDAAGLLRADHFLHLRCELPAPDMPALFETAADHRLVRMVSLMDHTPGVGQNGDVDRYRALRRREGMSEADVDRLLARLTEQRTRLREPHRRALLERARGIGVAIASHDDRTEADVAENAADGIRISEFPVSMAAAVAAKAAGMEVIAGAPNVVRGGSHSGNVSAAALVEAGVVDAFASDYVPASLIEAAFRTAAAGAASLPEAVAMITAAPARMANLADRGRIEPGLLADLVRVRVHEGLPVVRAVWRRGARVA